MHGNSAATARHSSVRDGLKIASEKTLDLMRRERYESYSYRSRLIISTYLLHVRSHQSDMHAATLSCNLQNFGLTYVYVLDPGAEQWRDKIVGLRAS